MEQITTFLLLFLRIYYYSIFIFIIMGWIQELRNSVFYKYLGVIVEPFFRVFRGWLVFGGLDFTPMLGLFLLNILLNLLSINL